jgi:transcriptional antiterminator RfaH
MRRWFVVYTHPREEAVAEENLARQGFATYWPRYRKRATHARRVREVASSLFPRYLFAAFDLNDPGWRAIRSTRGVAELVRQGLEPVPVPDGLVEEIRAREDRNGFVVIGRQIDLQPGQRIELSGEAFRGHELILGARKDADRVVALLSLLGREFAVSVPIVDIVPTSLGLERRSAARPSRA